MLCTFNYYSLWPDYKYFATLWLHITAIGAINKGAAHRAICRNKEKISYKVQRTEISNAWILTHSVHLPCIWNINITGYSADYMCDNCFSAGPNYCPLMVEFKKKWSPCKQKLHFE